MYKIDKNIPMPAKRARARMYPLDTMEVGDSFEIPADKVTSCRGSVHKFQSEHDGITFTVRKVNNDVYRVWRLT